MQVEPEVETSVGIGSVMVVPGVYTGSVIVVAGVEIGSVMVVAEMVEVEKVDG
jgi:hypothetical protein